MKDKKKTEPDTKLETPLERWFRYIVVPALGLLIGGSGILGYRSLTKDSSQKEPQKREQEQHPPQAKESQLFFASTRYSTHAEKDITISSGEGVTLHWDAPNEVYPRLGIHIITISGAESYSDPLNPYGAMTVKPTETTDYYLLDRDGPFKATTLATLRVKVTY